MFHDRRRLGLTRKRLVIVAVEALGISRATTLEPQPGKQQLITPKHKEEASDLEEVFDQGCSNWSWQNDNVLQGYPIGFNPNLSTSRCHSREPPQLKTQVLFDKSNDYFWTSMFPSQLVEHFSGDIKKFGKVLRLIHRTVPRLWLVTVKNMLRIFLFTKDFGDKMVFPLIAFFLGTGNHMVNVSCRILERLFNDPNMKLQDYKIEAVLPILPFLRTFPKADQSDQS